MGATGACWSGATPPPQRYANCCPLCRRICAAGAGRSTRFGSKSKPDSKPESSVHHLVGGACRTPALSALGLRERLGKGMRASKEMVPIAAGSGPAGGGGRRRRAGGITAIIVASTIVALGDDQLDHAARRRGRVGRRRRRQRHGDRASGGHVRRRGRERHALAIFPRVNGNHPSYRHQDLARLAAEPGPELDELIAQLQRVGGFMADVEDDLSVLDIFLRHLHGTVDTHGHIRRQAIVYAPFVHRTNQVGARGYGVLCSHGCGGPRRWVGGRKTAYLRMTFSEGVSAWM